MKKEKVAKDIFETNCWMHEVITDPYQVIAEIFSLAGIASFRKTTRKIICHSGAEKAYHLKSPGDIILDMKVIRSLIRAAYILKDKHNPIEVGETEVFDKKYFLSHYFNNDQWKDFPRCLSINEYCNPYRAFTKFFKFQSLEKWIACWEEIIEWALLADSRVSADSELVLYFHLAKLLEAAHLINVREVTHVGGYLKNRVRG